MRTERDQSKTLEKNENVQVEISTKNLIFKMLSESISQVTDSFDISNYIKSRRSTLNIADREKFELSQEEGFIQHNRTVKASNKMVYLTTTKDLQVHDTNSNTTVGITSTDYNRETVNNHSAKNKFDQNYYNIVRRREQAVSDSFQQIPSSSWQIIIYGRNQK